MCGLVGGVGFDLSQLKQLIHNVSRRGPDYIDSTEVAENLVFGHARLAIVDIDGESNQPMFDSKTGNWLIFNGEIYNHAEIRRSLPTRSFDSNCDTEVLLYALHELGVKKCLDLLRGMWAFAFWNAQRRELYLSRDHVGKKPLFVWSKDDKLLFGSEVKAFRPLLPRLSPRHSSVLSFLLNRTIGDSSSSFFSDIRQIQPGSFEVFKVFNSGARQIKTEFF